MERYSDEIWTQGFLCFPCSSHSPFCTFPLKIMFNGSLYLSGKSPIPEPLRSGLLTFYPD